METGQQVRLLCPWAKALNGSNRWQLDSNTEKVPSLSPGQGTLTNK